MGFLSAALSLVEVRLEFSFPLLASPHTSTQPFFTVLLHKIFCYAELISLIRVTKNFFNTISDKKK